MQLRVGDDAHRMRTRRQRDQPDPVAGADQVIRGQPARRRVAALSPGRIARPVVDRDPLLHAKPHRIRVVPVRLGEIEFFLDQADAAAGVDEPARAGLAHLAVRAVAGAMQLAVLVEVDVDDERAIDERDAAPRRLFGQEVLEDAAIDLVARHREIAARADLGHGVDVAPALRAEEAKAELLQLACIEMRFQAEHLGEVVGADLDRRLADLVRGLGHGMAAALEDQDVEIGERLLQLQRQREAGQAAAEDDDVVPRDGRRRGVGSMRVRDHGMGLAPRFSFGAAASGEARAGAPAATRAPRSSRARAPRRTAARRPCRCRAGHARRPSAAARRPKGRKSA